MCRRGMWRRPERFQQDAQFSYRRRGGLQAARGCGGGPERCRPRKFARRGTTPPYRVAGNGRPSRKTALHPQTSRAACRPPLQPNGNSQFSIFVLNLRKVVGRGLDPAAGMSRQAQRFQQDARFSRRRRGGVYAARERCGGPEHCGPRKFARRDQDPALRKTGTRRQRRTVRVSANRPGGLQAAPTTERKFAIFDFCSQFTEGRRAGSYPAAGTLRQTPRFPHTARFSCRHRGGVYAARERCGNPERCGPRKFARRGQNPALRKTGTRRQRRTVRVSANRPGGLQAAPTAERKSAIFDFCSQFTEGRRAGS